MIADLIRKLSNGDTLACLAKVISIDDDYTCTVSPVNGDADILEVRIVPDGKTGIKLTPRIGSIVIVDMLSNNHAYIAMVSEIDEATIKVDDKHLIFSSGGLEVISQTSNLGDEIKNIADYLDKLTTILLNLKVLTPVGPSTGLFPDNIIDITKLKVDLALTSQKLKQVLK